jgi:hypothetical protein
MTVVLDQRVTVLSGSDHGGASPGIDDGHEVIMKYLERWVDADGQIRCPDSCSIGLVTGMRAARSDAAFST